MFVGDAFARRNDGAYWSGWISGDGEDRKIHVTDVHFEENGLELTVDDGGALFAIKAVPKNLAHTAVYMNGSLVAGASLVFAPKGTVLNPTRYAFDFRPIPLNGNKARVNLRYDP